MTSASATRLLAVTSTPRSGSTLLCQLLSTHPDVMLAADPFLPLFRELRTAMLRAAIGRADPTAPFQDHYFTEERLRGMDAVQDAGLDLPFEVADGERFRAEWAARMQHECADLVPRIAEIRGRTFSEVFESGLRLIADVRGSTGRAWVGFKDVWVVEFFAAFARAYPDAKFVILVRDPRAVVASMHAIERVDATQVAHTLSYARHWRKYLAFAIHYGRDPLFAGRLLTIRYEDLVLRAEDTARELCAFLGLPFRDEMLDPRGYRDFSKGGEWSGNSSYAEPLAGISADQVDRWRRTLERDALELVELVCGPDMRLLGYEPTLTDTEVRTGRAALDYLVRNSARAMSWRSDLGDPQLDYGFELFRRALVEHRGPLGTDVVRRSFLFRDVYEAIQNPQEKSWIGPRASASSR